MRFWTAHTKPDAEPILVREGFSWGALIFGPFWLAYHRAWTATAIVAAADILVGVLVPEPFSIMLELGLALFVGLIGHDLRRWSIEARGYLLSHVLAARTETEALGRLLTFRPDLKGFFMPPEAAR